MLNQNLEAIEIYQQFCRGYLMFSFLSIDGIVDLLAVVIPNPDLLLDVVQELAPDEILDVGVVPPGISGIVFAGCDLLLHPGS